MIRRQFQAARAVFDQSQKMQGLGLARAFGQDLGEGFFGLTEAARVVGLNPGGQARAALGRKTVRRLRKLLLPAPFLSVHLKGPPGRSVLPRTKRNGARSVVDRAPRIREGE